MTHSRATGFAPTGDPDRAVAGADRSGALGHMPASASGGAPLSALLDLLRGRRIVVLAGAGCSTESGIPDYRGPETSRRPHRPMMYQEFVGSAAARARYWARSAVGWRRVADARPNPAHHALARLEAGGVVRGVITQNVDGLHQAAGSRRVVELHGTLSRVRCLGCARTVSRAEFQVRLLAVNARWAEAMAFAAVGGRPEAAPDGDAALSAGAYEDFRVPGCESCGGIVKPDVVFFGESVPRERVDRAWRLYESGDVLLVVGSSLAVYSGRRFVQRAQQEGVPIAIINVGATRADDAAAVKVEGRVGQVLPAVAEGMLGGR